MRVKKGSVEGGGCAVEWAVIFDGSVVHAGSKYTQHNTRVHLYLDVPSFAREPGYMSYVLERV